MFKKLEEVAKRHEELSLKLQSPNIVGNTRAYTEAMKEYSSLQELVDCYSEYKKIHKEYISTKEILEKESDHELREMAKNELPDLERQVRDYEQRLKVFLLPKDPNDEKNIFVEIRAGAGGDEASLFSEELFAMYLKFAASQGWKTEMMSASPGNVGGFKEVIFQITGDKVYSKMKYESGVHRVQRVPKTETQGRIHTSTVTVAVLPEAEELDVQINMNDVKIDVFRSSGAGGQSVNTTDSAVRLTHIPTGMVISCQDERSQLKNRAKAFKILAARLYELERQKRETELSQQRLGQIGTGDRSERIRTYNFPQGRVTDHRIGLTLYQIADVMNGKLSDVIDPLIAHYQAEALKTQGIQ